MEKKLKPIKCWDCFYLAKCMNCCEDGCEKFTLWHYLISYLAQLLNVNQHTLRGKMIKNDAKTMVMINEQLKPMKFRIEKVDGRKYIVRVK